MQSSSKMKLLTVVWLDSKGKGHLGKTRALPRLPETCSENAWSTASGHKFMLQRSELFTPKCRWRFCKIWLLYCHTNCFLHLETSIQSTLWPHWMGQQLLWKIIAKQQLNCCKAQWLQWAYGVMAHHSTGKEPRAWNFCWSISQVWLNRTKPGGSLWQLCHMSMCPSMQLLKIFSKLWLGLFSNAFLVQCQIWDMMDYNSILQILGGRKEQENLCLAKQSLLRSGLIGNAKAKFFIYHIGTKMMVCAANVLPRLHPSKISPALHLGGMKG